MTSKYVVGLEELTDRVRGDRRRLVKQMTAGERATKSGMVEFRELQEYLEAVTRALEDERKQPITTELPDDI
jgi:hypothetical protein